MTVNKKNRFVSTLPFKIISGLLVAIGFAAACASEAGGERAEEISEMASDMTPFPDDIISPVHNGTNFVAPGEKAAVIIPETASGKVVLTRQRQMKPNYLYQAQESDEEIPTDTNISIDLPSTSPAYDAVVAENGSIVYESIETNGVDIVVRALKGGSVRIETIIPSEDAEHEFPYVLGIPENATATINEEGGVDVVDDSGKYIGGVSKPWARDVNGNAVETTYRIEGNTLFQTVSQVHEDDYPIIADPWLGLDLIKKVTRKKEKGGYRYFVTPTVWGRVGAGTAARWSAWKEARSYYSAMNRTNLRDQFMCHFDLRLATFAKGSWNLESYRKDVGYPKTVAARCNP